MKRYLSHRRSITLLIVLLSFSVALVVGLPADAQGPVGKSFPPHLGTTWGTPQALGDGQIQTFVTMDASRNPRLVGVYFTESALSGLQDTLSDGHWDVKDANGNVVIPCCGHEVVLDFPAAGLVTPFKHFVLNWTPFGHEPPGTYDVPHFDLHFYTIFNDDRMAISAATAETMCSVPNPPDVGGEHPVAVSCETFEEAMMPLADEQMPPGYIAVGAVAPGMGNHLMNAQAPEMAEGKPFTHTWIYGTYAGKMISFEPMITLAFLEEQNEEVCTAIAMPEAMSKAGYYPTQYCVRYLAGENGDEGAYVVSLESLVEF
jgi:hypothetical protein